MPITPRDLFMGLIVLFFLCAPWWLPWAERNIRAATWDRIGRFALLPGLPLLAFISTFGITPGFWDDRYAESWNDGSLGFMSSEHQSGAYSGGPGWNDLNWLGEKEGPYPFGIYYCLLWLSNRPDVLCGGILLGLIVFGIFRYMKTGRQSL